VGFLALAAPTTALAAPSLSSNADQYLFVGDPPTPISAATVTDEATTPAITAANDVRIRIPAGFPMTWHPGDLSAVVGGSAAAKVSTTVTLEDANATLVIDVVTDFAASDQIVVSGLSFASFSAASGFDNLELEVGNDDVVTALDARTIKVITPAATRSSAIKITPDGSEVWVVNPDHGSVSVISTATNTLLAEIPVGANPWTVDLHPWNGEAWVASMDDDRVDILDVATRAPVDTLEIGYETFGVAFNPQGTTALVTSSGSDKVFAVDVASRSTISTISVYRRPRGIAWRDDGVRAWVSHLLMPEIFGRVTTVFPSTWTTAPISIGQVFSQNLGGYPSTVQNITVAPAPGDSLLWIPNNMIHTSNGQLFGNPLTATNMFHACIRPVNLNTSADMVASTFYLSEAGTDVGGPIAVDFKSGRAYVANLHSDNVTVLTSNILATSEVAVVPAGAAPIGIVTHPTLNRAYVANWLGRSVTVINTSNQTVVTTVPTTGSEVLGSQVLNGKKLFFTSTGSMSVNQRASCASCHVFGTHDARPWDLSQFGKHLRSTPDVRGIGHTGAHDWTGDKDEMADHNFGILEFAGGPGLIPGGGNPPLGAPNSGLSQDMDDIGRWMATLSPRKDTPFLNPDGSQTANADSGEVLFNDPVVACADCHVSPFFTDSRLGLPFIKHDVGTADPADTDAAAGFDTPSLIGVWDTGPYLHNHLATTLQAVMTTFNTGDQHGTTSHLSSAQIDFIAEYVKSIRWPDSTGSPVDAPLVAEAATGSLQGPFPNPFTESTSLSFSVAANDSRVEIDVFDVRGRLVAPLLDRRLTRGRHIVGWDSRDASGTLVAPGVYFARYRVNGEPGGEKKMVVLR
jgi:YVTN family beta-propeller protein